MSSVNRRTPARRDGGAPSHRPRRPLAGHTDGRGRPRRSTVDAQTSTFFVVTIEPPEANVQQVPGQGGASAADQGLGPATGVRAQKTTSRRLATWTERWLVASQRRVPFPNAEAWTFPSDRLSRAIACALGHDSRRTYSAFAAVIADRHQAGPRWRPLPPARQPIVPIGPAPPHSA